MALLLGAKHHLKSFTTDYILKSAHFLCVIGVIISLAWLATGFNITAANSAPITMSEALTPMSTCHKHT